MKPDRDIAPKDAANLRELVSDRTPARLLVGRSGVSYTTATQLQMRADHAAARDAVSLELDMLRDFGPEFVERWHLFEVRTRARTKSEYLLQPHLGRELDPSSAGELASRCVTGADLQIVIGDGLSVAAVAAQVPPLLPLLIAEGERHGWTVGQPFVIRHCRVGVMNAIGELLRPRVVVLLIGERPGMSTADSLSAYMAYQPTRGHTDADRNLVCNIHARGVRTDEAALRITRLAAELMRAQRSGASVKEPSALMTRPSTG